MLKLITITTLLAVTGLLVSTPASAYEKGDFIVRVGAAAVEPDDGDSDEIYAPGGAYPGSGLDMFARVDSNTQLGLSFTYMLNSHWGVELLAATPFKHDIELHSGVIGKVLSRAATTKHLPPTISLQWYPMDSSSKLQPYIGVGVNYTIFFEEDMSSAFDAATSPAGALADTDLELDDSIGLAAQLGLDWSVTDRVSLNAAVWWVDIDTGATIDSPGAATAPAGPWDTRTKFDVEIDPWVYMVGISYKF